MFNVCLVFIYNYDNVVLRQAKIQGLLFHDGKSFNFIIILDFGLVFNISMRIEILYILDFRNKIITYDLASNYKYLIVNCSYFYKLTSSITWHQ